MTRNKCPYCHSTRTVWRGYRYNEKSKKRMRLCNACKRKFTPRDRFWRMRFSGEEILKAVALRRKGFSSAEAKKHLERRGIRVSRWTILKWAKKYDKHK